MYLDGYQKDVGDLVSYVGKLVMCVIWVCGVEGDVFVYDGGWEPARLRAPRHAIDLPRATKGIRAF